MLCEQIQNMGQIPPCDQFKLGHQNDSGPYWCILAHTAEGPVPGKGRQGSAWYPHGGKEHETKSFSFLRVQHGATLSLVRAGGHPPHNALDLGRMRDGSVYHVVICHTPHGNIPGKAKGNKGWFCFSGREHETNNFSFVVAHGHHGHQPRPSHALTPGATVRLTSKAHGKNLRINNNGQVDGRGGTGEWATFSVQGRGPHIALSLARHPQKFLAIKNHDLTHGTGGKFCSLMVKSHPDGTISLESVEHRSQHVGILPNGDVKGPHQTGTGDHGKFYVNFA